MRVSFCALEGFEKFYKLFAVWGKAMLYVSRFVFFIDESGLVESAGMLANCFLIGIEYFRYVFESNTIIFRDNQKNLYSSMISYSLEMPFNLLRCF